MYVFKYILIITALSVVKRRPLENLVFAAVANNRGNAYVFYLVHLAGLDQSQWDGLEVYSDILYIHMLCLFLGSKVSKIPILRGKELNLWTIGPNSNK